MISYISKFVVFKYNWIIASYIGSDVSKKFYKRLLNREYVEHLSSSVSDSINNCTINITYLIQYILSFLSLIASIASTILIVFALFIIDWKIAVISVLVLSSLYISISKYTKNYLRKNSKYVSNFNKIQINNIQESFENIRDIILDQSYKTPLNIFSKIETNKKRIKEANMCFVGIVEIYY